MIYKINPETQEVVEFQNIDSIGEQISQWLDATQLQIDAYHATQLKEVKQRKIDQLCFDYDNAYVVRLQWTFNGITNSAILKNRAYPYDNREYAQARIINFKQQVLSYASLMSDTSVINTYQTIYGRDPVQTDFYRVPLHKYTNGRVKYIDIKTTETSAFLDMCDDFLTVIATGYENSIENPYTSYNYYMLNQVKHVENIYNCTTIQEVEDYQYEIEDPVLEVDPNVIQDVVYLT